MKIAYIANIKIPTVKAHGIQIMKTCEAFADLGHEIELILPNRGNDIKEDPFFYYSVKENFKIICLWCIDTVHFGFLGYLLEWASFAERVFWREVFNKKDVYFGRDYLSLFYLSLFGRKTVWETHTGEWNSLIRLFVKTNFKIIAISDGLKDFYVSKGVSPDKIVVAHDAVDIEQFSILVNKEEVKKDLGLETKLPIAMYAGSLGSWKGASTLLEASKELIGKVQIVIVGGYESELISLKEKYKNVLFLGYKHYKELPKNQTVADVLIVPNTEKDIVSAKYTSPLKIFAHMVSGIPIIASDLPSIREILNENNAYFTIPDDSTSLAKKIMHVINNYEEAMIKSKKAKIDVQQYSWKKRAEIILSNI